MKTITLLTHWIDLFTERLGRIAAWSSVLMVLVTCYIVVTRYVFNIGSIAVQESVLYLNALLFMLCAGFTLKHNGHVRVDVLYGKASGRRKAIVDLIGSVLLLLPVCIFIFIISWPYVLTAWSIKEQSGDPGGLTIVYLLKTMILLLAAVLILQGIAEILRNFAILFAPDSALARAATNNEDEEEHVV